MSTVYALLLAVAVGATLFIAYNVFHYALFWCATHLKDASAIGHRLNDFERRQQADWRPVEVDVLRHDDEQGSYDDVFGKCLGERSAYNACTFPRGVFTHPNDADLVLLDPRPGMRLLDLGCGSGEAAFHLVSQRRVEVLAVTNSPAQAEICRRKFASLDGQARVLVADFDRLELPEKSFDAIYTLESLGYTRDMDAWLARCWRLLKPGGRLLIRTPGGLENCRTEADYRGATEFFRNWRYNFAGANLLVHKLRGLGFGPIRYREIPFIIWGLTWNYIRLMLLWKTRLRMRTMVDLERTIWRASKRFVLGQPYVVVLATKPLRASCPPQLGAGGVLPVEMSAPHLVS